MLKQILQNKEFLQEKITFNIIELILKSDSIEYLTDGENYLICRSNPETPIWIWNKDNVSEEKIEEILLKLETLLDETKVIQITSKKEIFERLYTKYKNLLVDNYFMQNGDHLHMKSYKCSSLTLPRPKVGYKERPTEKDIDLLAYFEKCDIEDTIREEYSSRVTQEQLYSTARSRIDNPNFYVWKIDDRIVATAAYIEGETECRVSMVFTNREDRGKGYAGMIVHELCEEIISKGKTPILYTDYDYISSNRAYEKIGFEPVGDLYNIKVGKTKIKELTR